MVRNLFTSLGKDLLSAEDFASNLDYGISDGRYYLAVRDEVAWKLLKEANAQLMAAGGDVTTLGKDAKLSGTLYMKYLIITKEGYRIDKEDKIKVNIVIPHADYARLKQKFS